ncbi:MAG: hypothetical protein L3J69_19330 [Desulfobacula sp.]|nr:hypothetical protein [Desulfobacula sp.]
MRKEHLGSKISGKGAGYEYYKVLRSPGISVTGKDMPDVEPDNTGVAVKVKCLNKNSNICDEL